MKSAKPQDMDIPAEAVARFWRSVDRAHESSCWLWAGCAVDKRRGYGAFIYKQVRYRAHRLSYHLCYGPIPEGMEIDHRCGNKMCVNPVHLRACTHAENMKNVPIRSTNKTGCKGVFMVKKSGNFSVTIAHNGVRRRLGTYKTIEEARAVYIRHAKDLHGEYFNPGVDRGQF